MCRHETWSCNQRCSAVMRVPARAQHISAHKATGCLSNEHLQVLGHPDWQLMRDLTSLETQDLLNRYQSKLMSKNHHSQASMSALPHLVHGLAMRALSP